MKPIVANILKNKRTVAIVAAGLLMVAFWFFFWFRILGRDLPKTEILRSENAAWNSRTEVLRRQLELYEETLEGVEDRNDDLYRSIYGLKPIPEETKTAGFSGGRRYEYLDSLGADRELKSVVRGMDVLLKRAYIQSIALDEVHALSARAGEMALCVPSVPPLCPDRRTFSVTSPFGHRIDPVYGGSSYHDGVDLATFRGNPVYATGDGVVEYADCKFRGYGNEVVIDHGYGYKTRYAHLNLMTVMDGMTVHRGEQIGEAGNTGKSTGVHLHYEVLYRGAPVNPMNYMDLNMPVSEFRAMAELRREESPRDRKSTTTELLKRRRKSNE